MSETEAKTFEEKVQELVEFTPKGVPYLIFKKNQNPRSELYPRNDSEVVPFLFKLDGAQGTLLQVSIYERKGWPVVHVNLPTELVAKDERLLDIHRHLESHKIYQNTEIGQVVLDKGDVSSKLQKKLAEATKAEEKKATKAE